MPAPEKRPEDGEVFPEGRLPFVKGDHFPRKGMALFLTSIDEEITPLFREGPNPGKRVEQFLVFRVNGSVPLGKPALISVIWGDSEAVGPKRVGGDC